MWFSDFFSCFLCFFLVGLGLVGMYLFKNTKPDFSHIKKDYLCLKRTIMRFLGRGHDESGNVFLAIFGAVAMVAILGTSVMTFMKGPLATSVKLTKMNTAENQMAIGAQVAVMATASQANNGDCELIDPDGAGPLPPVGDNFVEPIEWRAATTEPKPTGGGLVPLSLGISKKDPWGTEYGYCVWNHGPSTSGAGCGINMLEGANARIYPVVSIISAGPDKAFTTTCRDFSVADVNGNGNLLDATDLPLVSKASESDDDVITSFTYEEATGASGGLWSLKSGEPGTAVIGKNIETTGTATLGGGLLLPDKSFVTCDASTAGVMAMNGDAIEICDGTGNWTAITGGAGGGMGLSLDNGSPTPNVSSGMDIDGTCGTATCYSDQVVFTLTNKLTTASDVLATSLSNTLNYEKVSDNCNGNSIAAGASCQMVVRAKASGNVSYAATLNVAGNNSPLATLDGTAINFPGCNAGGNGPGGYYVACGVGSGYNLVVAPGGCSGGMTNPDCSGGIDTNTMQSHGVDFGTYISTVTSSEGAVNTLTLLGYAASPISFPAASYCNGFVYQGYDDWFLPSQIEMINYFYPNRVKIGGYDSSRLYITSNATTDARSYGLNSSGGSTVMANFVGNTTGIARCMRRDPSTTATPAIDTTPNALTFNASYGGPSETRTSNAVTIYGVTEPVTLAISGGIGAQYSKNGGVYTNIAGTVKSGDQIALRSTSPALGQQSVVTLTTGSISTNWLVRTPGNNTIRVFTTNATYTGNMGGVGGADSICTLAANAASLPGSWVAVVGSSPGLSLNTRLPWNWKTLRNMNSQTVAVSLEDFVDGSISAPMNYSQSSTIVPSSIWTGLQGDGSTNGNCTGWTSDWGNPHNVGDSGATTDGKYFYSTTRNCVLTLRLLCMETNQAGADTDPNAVGIAPQVTFSSGGTGTSNTVTITGVTDEIPVEIIPSAGTANIIKDGLSVGATTTMAGLNQTLSFTLTAPTTLGQKNTATITLGPDTYTWWVGYADAAREAKVFVTSGTYQGNLGGLSGADSICESLASNSSYGLSGNWKAILSSTSVNAGDRIPWNWGSLKTVTGLTIVDGGYPDLFDGSLDNPINITENGASVTGGVTTGTKWDGTAYSTNANAHFCANWSTNTSDWSYGPYGGNSPVSNTQWIDETIWNRNCTFSYRLYCIEDIDNAVADTTPNMFYPIYDTQVPVSSRQTSNQITIGGLSTSTTTTLSVTATAGSPTFTINGGAEVTSGSVQNGDNIIFLMNAPATGNSSNRMTITAGSMTTYWRVWTGDTTGTAVKRMFVTRVPSTAMTGLTGYDSACTSRATAAGLGGTWRAILSGVSEPDFAVNRVGYNWTTLRRVDGVDIALSGNLWSTNTVPLLSTPSIMQTGATLSETRIMTNTTSFGMPSSTNSSQTWGGSCNNWVTNSSSFTATDGTSGTTSSSWINDGSPDGANCYTCCGSEYRVYCIEQ